MSTPAQPMRMSRDRAGTNQRRGRGLLEHRSRPEQEPRIVFWRNDGVDTTLPGRVWANQRPGMVTRQPIRGRDDAT